MEWRRPFTRRKGKRTTFAEDDNSACCASRHRARPVRMYAGSRPRASQTFSKPNGQSVADAANHSSDSVNKRCPRRVEEEKYFWKGPTAASSTATLRRFSGGRDASVWK